MKKKLIKLKIILLLFIGLQMTLSAQVNSNTTENSNPQLLNQSQFTAGAAKVDITPSVDNLPANINGIHDHLFTRVIVIDNGETRAALISIDCGVNEVVWKKYAQRIENELGIPIENIFLSPSHSHSSIFLPREGSSDDPNIELFASNVDKAIIEVVTQASENLQPARISYAEGKTYLNVNRDVIDPETRLWSQAPNYDGVSDKTVAIIKIEDLSGEPIAVYYNYAMHPNTMFYSGVLSADFPGMASEYVEEYYDNKLVALWSMGAAGDQNPISTRPMMDVGQFKTQAALDSGLAKDEAEAIMMGSSMDIDVDPKVLRRQSRMIESLGQLLGEEILRAMEHTDRTETNFTISGSQKIVTCPGRIRTNTGRQGAPGTYVDGDPIDIRLSLLKIGDIALTAVDAEVYNLIAQRLKDESPYAKTIMATTTNGSSNSGYIPSDDAFVRHTFQVLGSRLQPGHAEGAIVDGLLDLMSESK